MIDATNVFQGDIGIMLDHIVVITVTVIRYRQCYVRIYDNWIDNSYTDIQIKPNLLFIETSSPMMMT